MGTTWWGRRTRGVTIGIVEVSAIIIVMQLTIAKQLWAIACVAAKCSLIVPRSSSLGKAIPLNLRRRPLQPTLLRLRLLQLLPLLLLRRPLRVHLLQLHRVAVKARACGMRIARRILGALTRHTILGALLNPLVRAHSAPKHPTRLHHQSRSQSPNLSQNWSQSNLKCPLLDQLRHA